MIYFQDPELTAYVMKYPALLCLLGSTWVVTVNCFFTVPPATFTGFPTGVDPFWVYLDVSTEYHSTITLGQGNGK